ncbi:MAG: AAA family ATPase [Actinomycetota bacterium]|nr:AAA family ATPase [Actinomycetota bacterium]
MALLVPEDLSLDGLPKSERQFIRRMLPTLSDDWLMVPQHALTTPARDFETDVVMINQAYGVLAVEVKGGSFTIRDGQWYTRGEHRVSPWVQARKATYELRDWLQDRHALLHDLNVQYAVALMDVVDLVELDGSLPAEIARDQLLLASDLSDPDEVIERAMATGDRNHMIGSNQVTAVVNALCPDVDFVWDPQVRATHARASLNGITADQTGTLATLDLNRHVVVSGPAGSGKTRLVCEWAARAVARKERTLLTCFNRAMAETLVDLGPEHDLLTVMGVQRFMRTVEGPPSLPIPADAGEDWWRIEPFRRVLDHIGDVVVRFDTIVVDEGQDFDPLWFEALDALLDKEGRARMLVVADPGQGIFDRDFALPDARHDLVRAELVVNCRNTRNIARQLRRFGGARPARGVPKGDPIVRLACDDATEVTAKVGYEVEAMLRRDRVDPENLMVLTGHTKLRDRIRADRPEGVAFTSWDDRSDGGVVCETLHKLKGLERDVVVLATVDTNLDNEEFYVAASRAVSRLIVIGPPELLERLGPWG